MSEAWIEVVGGGAIGGTIAASLHGAGTPVRVIDTDEAHVRAIRREGLCLRGMANEVVARVPSYLPGEAPSEPVGAIYLCTKIRDSEAAMVWARDRLAPDGYVLSLQNGLHHASLAAHVGPRRVVPGLVNFFADVAAPGVVDFGGPGTIAVGETDGTITQRLRDIQEALSAVGPVEVTDNILGYAWSKMAYGIVLVATALTDATMEECVLSAHQGALLQAANEVLRVARARGVRPVAFDGWDPAAARAARSAADTAAVMADVARFLRGHEKVRSGVWRDIAVRRRRTEVHAQFEPVVAMGREAGVATPTLARLLALIGELEEGRRERSWANLDDLAAASRT